MFGRGESPEKVARARFDPIRWDFGERSPRDRKTSLNSFLRLSPSGEKWYVGDRCNRAALDHLGKAVPPARSIPGETVGFT